jgi:hypothetical protein
MISFGFMSKGRANLLWSIPMPLEGYNTSSCVKGNGIVNLSTDVSLVQLTPSQLHVNL